ncbi:P-loop containing nucleoside triphosphate hydrolase protein [Hypoxylon sp. NC1633]|nr:P-loop containing nucleoside triphosphate hydrolase protein [Hypoxylon sp. NC1633]
MSVNTDSACNADINNKKIHPFFTAKNASKNALSNTVTPVTPDPSCSPNSIADNDTDTNPTSPPASGSRTCKRKREIAEPNNIPDTPTLDSTCKPQKMLKLNPATGTIGSPPKSDPTSKGTNTRRGRKLKILLASISYRQDDYSSRLEIGQIINEVLAGTRNITHENIPPAVPSTPASDRDTNKDNVSEKKAASQLDESRKPTHPFFQGKTKSLTAAEEKQTPGTRSPPKRHVFLTSSNSSRQPRPTVLPNFNMPTPGMNSGILRVPGAQHPLWPTKEMAHVRGDTLHPPNPREDMQRSERLRKERRAKGQQVQVADVESVLQNIATNLNLKQAIDELRACHDDSFRPPPPILRVPTRHFESGKKLQSRIIGELKTPVLNSDVLKTHPAISNAYNSIEKGLSAFDMSTCETSTWAQKYAPSSAARVLQRGREVELLRDWLENLKVLSVDKGTTDAVGKSKAAAPAKGRSKRKKKLDGFVVSSDEENDELDELSDAGGDWAPSGSQSGAKKTVIRSVSSRPGSRNGVRFANAVILSGPHGCGKTAAVYAVARELEFEVFEISPGVRRNGKDVLEKVGDMTRNHLVQHQQVESAPPEGAAVEDEVERDLKSGKQGTMTAFFKPKQAAAQKPTKKSAESSRAKVLKKSVKAQKQSLILLEEVDILYEEDKQFWATVISMMFQSKRPFIMTCTDETLVPMQSMNLHGIFRFSSPPKDLALDYLLLIAANEGHALGRRAVETLYDSRGHDLRASITELNYWCQVGVGDVQGGFNWFYPRWPKGSDVDEEGDVIRIISQDTYQAGMGWLGRDSAIASSSSRSAQEELYQQIYQNWSLDAFESHPNDESYSWAVSVTKRCSSAEERLALLESVDSLSSFVSDSDISSVGLSAVLDQVSMDASIPNLPMKAKEDFIVGQQLLEVSPLVRYDTTSLDMATAVKALGRSQLGDSRHIDGAINALEPLDESRATARLEQHFSRSLSMKPVVTRLDYSLAFDPIAVSEKTVAAGYLDPSVFDGTTKTIALDVAPYVRSIVAYDQQLQKERLLRSNLLSEGGQPGKKRIRTTRSAYSALEGSSRASTRRDKYFSADVNPHLVMRTGGEGWCAIANTVAAERAITDSVKSTT